MKAIEQYFPGVTVNYAVQGGSNIRVSGQNFKM